MKQSLGPGDSHVPLQTIVTGDYYVVATDTTEVQSVYVHNQFLFADSLSFSFGPVGIGIDLSSAKAAIYYAKPLTLPGYSNKIHVKTLSIAPGQLNFPEAYFFSEIEKNHSIDDWNFITKRLRTGHIENQYVNLSANRIQAGEAYLEFDFTTDVYNMTVDLTFWSAKEFFKPNDIAYIEFFSKDNIWIKKFDILNNSNSLPTDRNNPKKYSFDFVEGTKKIRFYSYTPNPTADRNKGRICIGNIEFTSYLY